MAFIGFFLIGRGVTVDFLFLMASTALAKTSERKRFNNRKKNESLASDNHEESY